MPYRGGCYCPKSMTHPRNLRGGRDCSHDAAKAEGEVPEVVEETPADPHVRLDSGTAGGENRGVRGLSLVTKFSGTKLPTV